MSEQIDNDQTAPAPDIRGVVRNVIEEFVKAEQSKAEPAYKAELLEERKRREALEARLNHLVEENRRAQAVAEEADRHSQIRAELQRMGVSKVDLAFRAVKDDIIRGEDGRLMARDAQDPKPAAEYLRKFVEENPELLPARIGGGGGVHSTTRNAVTNTQGAVDVDKIKPGMSREELERIRQEVARFAAQSLRGA